jgi:hypothetical protein
LALCLLTTRDGHNLHESLSQSGDSGRRAQKRNVYSLSRHHHDNDSDAIDVDDHLDEYKYDINACAARVLSAD